MSFENLKSSRGSSIDKLVKAAEAVSTPKADNSSYGDDRLWKPTRDKAGNGYAVIRFLPAKEGEDLPWVRYVSNILVISDPENPQNNGKVFLYQFGKRIFDKVMDVMQPQFADENPVNPYDFWEGADFKIKIRKVDGWVNYDKSEFSSPSALMDGNEAELESVYGKLF